MKKKWGMWLLYGIGAFFIYKQLGKFGVIGKKNGIRSVEYLRNDLRGKLYREPTQQEIADVLKKQGTAPVASNVPQLGQKYTIDEVRADLTPTKSKVWEVIMIDEENKELAVSSEEIMGSTFMSMEMFAVAAQSKSRWF